MRDRYRWLRRIEQLDPVRDHQEIYRISAGHEFPWDYQRALELALFRTYCVPSISALLAATGEFRDRPQKRYDDTALLMAELAAHGYDSPAARRRCGSSTGCTAATRSPPRTCATCCPPSSTSRSTGSTGSAGGRCPTHERLAAFHFYREVGARMGIRDVPADFDEFRRFKTGYEAASVPATPRPTARSATTRSTCCAAGTRGRCGRRSGLGVRGLLDAPMLTAFGFDARPALGWRAATRAGLRARAGRRRRCCRRGRRVPAGRATRATARYPGYPTGYRPADLGAPDPGR